MYEIKLVRSVLEEDAPGVIVSNPRHAVDYALANCYKPEDMWREYAWAIVLNKKNQVLGHFLLSVGGTDSTVIEKKTVAKVAIESMAGAVVLVHNHPSGDSRPSAADIKQTGEVKKALDLFDIQLLDHVVIGDGEFYSFSESIKFKI